MSPAHAAGADVPGGVLRLSSLETAFRKALGLIALARLFVPLARRLGLGTVIGYLAAGVTAGAVLRLSYAEHPEALLHFAEFGVVLFLFVIGLEFRPARLWELRGTIFGRGLAQMLACGAVLGGAALAFGLDWRAAVIVSLGPALSSTALVIGRHALDPMFRALARMRTPELMTAAALGVVVFASLVMAGAGLSYAMGAFIAGTILAGSSFRHEVEADVEPFRALFLGLFFVAVALSLDLRAVAENWLLVLAAVPVLIVLKALAIYAVGRLFGSPHQLALRIAFAMGQHGEFGFVLFAAAGAAAILDAETASLVVSIVALSMAISSQSGRFHRMVVGRAPREAIEEDFADAQGSVLVIGFGRVGQMVAQPLVAEGVAVTLLDHDAERVCEAARFGVWMHFGNGTRREVLHASGAGEARAIVVATDDPETTLAIGLTARRSFPKPALLVHAHDRIHAVRLANEDMPADTIVRETLASALELGAHALEALGYGEGEARDAVARIRRRDAARLDEQIAAARGREGRRAIVDAIAPEPLTRRGRASRDEAARTGIDGTETMTAIEGAGP